ncbi:MAG: tetratricopeptide repeat protein, partial [Planctomycetota bacterium]|nr:tetratricopeptide repeat protein [Planctomycetota bacterium]
MDFSKHIQKAEEAARRRNYDFAVELYQQLVELDPDHGEARAGLRRVLRQRHAKKSGGKLFGALKGATPLAVAKGLAKAGKHAAAAKSLESYLASNPLDEAANLSLGNSLEEAGHFHGALAVYEFLAEIAPRNPEGLKRAGHMLHRTGSASEALAYFERALEADPRDQEALKARKDLAAETALSSGNFSASGHSRERLVDKAETQRLERSRRMQLSGEELLEELERLRGLYAEAPADTELMVQMAGVLDKQREYEEALDLAERALSYKKDSFELVTLVGELRRKVLKRSVAAAGKRGEEDEANRLERELWRLEADDCRQRLQLHPGDATLHLELGRALMRLGDHDGAAGELQKAIGDPRLEGDALFHLAQCFQ